MPLTGNFPCYASRRQFGLHYASHRQLFMHYASHRQFPMHYASHRRFLMRYASHRQCFMHNASHRQFFTHNASHRQAFAQCLSHRQFYMPNASLTGNVTCAMPLTGKFMHNAMEYTSHRQAPNCFFLHQRVDISDNRRGLTEAQF